LLRAAAICFTSVDGLTLPVAMSNESVPTLSTSVALVHKP
jgi:hypothetical protein